MIWILVEELNRLVPSSHPPSLPLLTGLVQSMFKRLQFLLEYLSDLAKEGAETFLTPFLNPCWDSLNLKLNLDYRFRSSRFFVQATWIVFLCMTLKKLYFIKCQKATPVFNFNYSKAVSHLHKFDEISLPYFHYGFSGVDAD